MGKLGLKNTSKRIDKLNKKPKKNIEEILESIHEEKIKKLTIRMPDSLHRKLKAKVAFDGSSINEYVIALVRDSIIGDSRLDL